MMPKILQFLKSPVGMIAAFVAVVIGALAVVKQSHPAVPFRSEKPSKLKNVPLSGTKDDGTSEMGNEPLIERRDDYVPFRPLGAEIPREQVPVPQKSSEGFSPLPKLIQVWEEEPIVPKTAKREAEELNVPPGTLIAAQLLNAVDSAIPGPLIGHTTLPVKVSGKIVVPVGSEIHGTVRDHLRDRLMTGTTWQLVLPSGKAFHVGGIGLNRDYVGEENGYGADDGLAGIKGVEIRGDARASQRLFAATAISGFSKAFQERSRSLLGGEQVMGTLQNGGLSASSAVTDQYAGQLLKEVEANKPFVRVAAGKDFYLYTQVEVVVKGEKESDSSMQQVLQQREALMNQLREKISKNGALGPTQ